MLGLHAKPRSGQREASALKRPAGHSQDDRDIVKQPKADSGGATSVFMFIDLT
jgi:hypothetical protein